MTAAAREFSKPTELDFIEEEKEKEFILTRVPDDRKRITRVPDDRKRITRVPENRWFYCRKWWR